MTYGSQVWGQVKNIHTNAVFSLQHKAMRIISFADFHAPCDSIYHQLKVLKLEDYVKLLNLIFTKSSLEQTFPSCFNNYFTYARDVHEHKTVHATAGCLFLPSVETSSYGLNSITQKCIKEWNYTIRFIKHEIPDISLTKIKNIMTNIYL